MSTYIVEMNGWSENEFYTILAESEGDAIQEAYSRAEAPWSSLVEVEKLV